MRRADGVARGAAATGVATCEHHVRTARSEHASRLEPDPAVRAGHDRDAIREIRNVIRAPGTRAHRGTRADQP